jgi:hypothetical protein
MGMSSKIYFICSKLIFFSKYGIQRREIYDKTQRHVLSEYVKIMKLEKDEFFQFADKSSIGEVFISEIKKLLNKRITISIWRKICSTHAKMTLNAGEYSIYCQLLLHTVEVSDKHYVYTPESQRTLFAQNLQNRLLGGPVVENIEEELQEPSPKRQKVSYNLACPHCSFHATSRLQLSRHNSKEHDGPKYPCMSCKLIFFSK